MYTVDNLLSSPAPCWLLPSTSISSLTLALVLVTLTTWARKNLANAAVRILSSIINIWLCLRNPIHHSETGRTLPTCPYQWPNGQGNVAKFLEGEVNRGQWSSKYGSIYRIWSGTTPEIVLTKPEHVQAVFRDSDKHSKAFDNNSGFLFGEILGQCVGLVSHGKWKALRSTVDGPFRHQAVTEYVDLVESRVRRYLARLRASESLLEGLVDPVMDLKMLPFLVVSDILYGPLDPAMERRLAGLAPRREGLFLTAIRGGWTRFRFSRHLPLAAIRELSWFKSTWAAFNRDAHSRALSTEKDVPICKLYQAVKLGTITEEQLLQTLDEMLFANLDVTMGGLSWNLVFLAAHPSAQERIWREISEYKDEKDEEGWRRRRRYYLLRSSSYLTACILESSRLRPLAAFSVPQAAPSERTIDGFRIPAGTNFIVDTHALNIANPFWQPDPLMYRPERFLEQESPWLRYNYWRFGFGPRQCLGKYVADLIIRVLLVQIIEEFELSLPMSAGEWSHASNSWINHPETMVKWVRRDSKLASNDITR